MQMGESGFGGLSGSAKLNFMAGQYARWKTCAFYVETLSSQPISISVHLQPNKEKGKFLCLNPVLTLTWP